MKAFITTTSFGFIATDEEFNVVDKFLFEKKQIEILEKIQQKQIIEEELELITRLSEKYDEIIIETLKTKSSYEIDEIEKISVEKTTVHGDYIREHFDEVLTQLTDANIRKTMNETYNEITSEKIRESIKTNDVMIVETINSLEEIEDTAGKLIERLREWCTPYLPEMEKLHNHELYSKVIATQTSRENIINSGILDNTHVSLSENYDVDISESDLEIIKSFANSVYSLYESKNELEEYIDEKIKEVAPNMYDVAGANLAAKLIAHTNGLENLAKLPSSTIQIIGAEKAIFRHLKTGENPPKHGLIFQHPSIRGSNWWVRGKLARAVASKITIAARKDAFSNEYDPNLKVELDERIEEIKKSHPFPERKKNKKEENDKKSKKGKKSKKEKGKKKKRNKRKLRKGEYNY
ncbi:MAG: ATP-binding protein [Methanosphaera sp.]|uniref:NOP5/NOP56 family protein n=1 Tax=Methanosphaera sp. TaxID=2666342 RepID=UPI002E798049|nr:ATP-binding protein [Methanosphaera sp.]MEE1116624.1 ATP-binding protein [Methanosphaera sp.]MEE3418410.1 ATP-binding protein [Methanosphaera sp.]